MYSKPMNESLTTRKRFFAMFAFPPMVCVVGYGLKRITPKQRSKLRRRGPCF
jgi:hypothetical protein